MKKPEGPRRNNLRGLLFFAIIIIMNIDQLRAEAVSDLNKLEDLNSLEGWRVKYLGRKGELSKLFELLPEKSLEEKKQLGPALNNLKVELTNFFNQKLEELKTKNYKPKTLDITRPGRRLEMGHLHPLTIVEREIRNIFSSLNFSVVEGPELELEKYNFDALNFPKDHPARDMQDTLWVNRRKGLLMRTHTSAMQIRYMEKHGPPFQILVPGRVFRHEATDFAHETNFYQFEGLMVGKDISLANFKFVIQEFVKRFFKRPIEVRFRHSYFPFVEPGVEVDIKMPDTGNWLEVMGAGMVHPKVFEAVKYNPKEVQGFAFGGSIERFTMIKYGIPDIRFFYSSDLRFIKQF